MRIDNQFLMFQTYTQTEHMRMSGMYWVLTALDVMEKLEETNKEELLEFIKLCQCDNGGIGASVHHDPHLLYTLSAVQILCMYDALDVINIDKVISYVKERQQPDGSFTGDQWGEVDVRFSFCAIATLSLLVSIAEHYVNSKVKIFESENVNFSYDIRNISMISESFGCDKCGESSRIYIKVHEF